MYKRVACLFHEGCLELTEWVGQRLVFNQAAILFSSRQER